MDVGFNVLWYGGLWIFRFDNDDGVTGATGHRRRLLLNYTPRGAETESGNA